LTSKNSRPILLEDAFDSGNDSLPVELWPEAAHLIALSKAANWKEIYLLAPSLVRSLDDIREKAFVIQWAVAAAETEYDLTRRDEMLALWAEVSGWAADPYCLYVRTMCDGLTRFFSGALRDASVHFQEAFRIAEAAAYERGKMRSLFHLGLVEQDRGNFQKAGDFLARSLDLAIQRKAANFKKRIEGRLQQLSQLPLENFVTEIFSEHKLQIEGLLEQRSATAAREVLLELELHRRKLGYGRKRESLGAYLGLVMISSGRERGGLRIIARLSDPVVKLKTLLLKKKLFESDHAENCEIEHLQKMLGVSQIIFQSTLDQEEIEIAGVPLRDVRDAAVKKLILAFLKSPKPLSKEDIVQLVWGYRYEPVAHDRKIYNLIHKAKLVFGVKDLFLNTYGAYELNPRLLGRSIPA